MYLSAFSVSCSYKACFRVTARYFSHVQVPTYTVPLFTSGLTSESYDEDRSRDFAIVHNLEKMILLMLVLLKMICATALLFHNPSPVHTSGVLTWNERLV